MYSNRSIVAIVLMAIVLTLFGCKRTQEDNGISGRKKFDLGRPQDDEKREAELLKTIHNSKLYMVMVAKTASTNAISAQVRHLADTVFKNEALLNGSLQQIAMSRNISLPVDLEREEHRKIDKLDRLEDKLGGAYDREFALQVKSKSEECIRNLRELQNLADESDLRNWTGEAIGLMIAQKQLAETTWDLVKDLKGRENPLTKDALR